MKATVTLNFLHTVTLLVYTESGMEGHSNTEFPEHGTEHCNHHWYPSGFSVMCMGSRTLTKWAPSHCRRLCIVWNIHCSIVRTT